jgi:endonuclease YncB( thermonuclease family)
MKKAFALSLILLFSTAPFSSAETLVLKPGDYAVTSAQSITFNGRSISLSGINAPEPGQMCVLRGHQRDCGKIARSQLLDLTAAATLVCELTADKAECASGGFDIAAQMVYTGWAVPADHAPAKYNELMKKAQAKSRGLWRARFTPEWSPRGR